MSEKLSVAELEELRAQDERPIARLREQHRRCSPCIFKNPWFVKKEEHCHKCLDPWPCDTIAALDVLEVEGRDIQFRMFELQTRLDAATELIRQAMSHIHMTEPL